MINVPMTSVEQCWHEAEPVLCVYHANCADGLGAAWAVHRALGPDVEYLAAKYGDPPPRAEGRDVLIVDFSYSLAELHALSERAASVLVLDHHKTAQRDLEELDPILVDWEGWLSFTHDVIEGRPPSESRVAALFDLERSGAGLTWDYLNGQVGPHGVQPALRPDIIDLIEDRDLWNFHHGQATREFHAVLASYDLDRDLPASLARLDAWNRFTTTAWSNLFAEGRAIVRAEASLVRGAVEGSRRLMKIAGHVVPVANVPGRLASEAGHLLCNEPLSICRTRDGKDGGSVIEWGSVVPPFSATYYDGADGNRHLSLRSWKEGADVGAIAKGYGGGGHPHAAGFDRPIGWEGDE